MNRNYERYMIRVNNDFKINKYIEAHLDVNYKRSKSEEPHRNPMDLQYRATPPIYARDGVTVCGETSRTVRIRWL